MKNIIIHHLRSDLPSYEETPRQWKPHLLVSANTCGIRILHIYLSTLPVPYMLLGTWPKAHVAAPAAGCLHLATKGKMKCRAWEANLYKQCQSRSAECVKLKLPIRAHPVGYRRWDLTCWSETACLSHCAQGWFWSSWTIIVESCCHLFTCFSLRRASWSHHIRRPLALAKGERAQKFAAVKVFAKGAACNCCSAVSEVFRQRLWTVVLMLDISCQISFLMLGMSFAAVRLFRQRTAKGYGS